MRWCPRNTALRAGQQLRRALESALPLLLRRALESALHPIWNPRLSVCCVLCMLTGCWKPWCGRVVNVASRASLIPRTPACARYVQSSVQLCLDACCALCLCPSASPLFPSASHVQRVSNTSPALPPACHGAIPKASCIVRVVLRSSGMRALACSLISGLSITCAYCSRPRRT